MNKSMIRLNSLVFIPLLLSNLSTSCKTSKSVSNPAGFIDFPDEMNASRYDHVQDAEYQTIKIDREEYLDPNSMPFRLESPWGSEVSKVKKIYNGKERHFSVMTVSSHYPINPVEKGVQWCDDSKAACYKQRMIYKNCSKDEKFGWPYNCFYMENVSDYQFNVKTAFSAVLNDYCVERDGKKCPEFSGEVVMDIFSKGTSIVPESYRSKLRFLLDRYGNATVSFDPFELEHSFKGKDDLTEVQVVFDTILKIPAKYISSSLEPAKNLQLNVDSVFNPHIKLSVTYVAFEVLKKVNKPNADVTDNEAANKRKLEFIDIWKSLGKVATAEDLAWAERYLANVRPSLQISMIKSREEEKARKSFTSVSSAPTISEKCPQKKARVDRLERESWKDKVHPWETLVASTVIYAPWCLDVIN